MIETTPQVLETRSKRPAMLTLLCILSFIGNGFMVLLGLGGILTSGYIANVLEEYSKGFDTISHEILLLASFSVLLVFGLKLWGVIMMYFGRKAGYILYLIPTGLLMILNIVLLFAAFNPIIIGFLLMSIIFVVLYSVFLKAIK